MDSEERTTAQKIIFFVLDLLLVAGAILCVLTIDRGKWLLSNPAFYQPPEAAPNILPVTGGSQDVSGAGPQGGGTCMTAPELTGQSWDNSYLLLNAYQMAVVVPDRPAEKAAAVQICGQ